MIISLLRLFIPGMHRIAADAVLYAIIILSIGASGCSATVDVTDRGPIMGTVELPLSTTARSGIEYVLTSGQLQFRGTTVERVDVGGVTPVLRVGLPIGGYAAALDDDWTLSRRLSDGSLASVTARLTSLQPQYIEVYENQVTILRLVFDVAGEAVEFPAGSVDIVLIVNELDAAMPDAGAVTNSGADAGEAEETCEGNCDSVCGNYVVEEGETCDDGPTGSNACSTACGPWERPAMPSELPDAPLVYLARGNASISRSGALSNDPFEGAAFGAPIVLVLAVHPTRPCVGSSMPCTTYNHDLGGTLRAAPQGYVLIGGKRYPLPEDVQSRMYVMNDEGVLLNEGISMGVWWNQTAPYPATFGINAYASSRGGNAGLTSTALPRNLDGLGEFPLYFEVQTIEGTANATAFNTEWTVVENGPHCGDGVVAPGVELCDDGNSDNGDGCSEQCTWEMTAPTTSGIRYTVYGHAGSGPGVVRGDAIAMTADALPQPTCPWTNCSYALSTLSYYFGNQHSHAESGTLNVNVSSVQAWGDGINAYAETALDQVAMPTVALTLHGYTWLNNSTVNPEVRGVIHSWAASQVICDEESCTCAPIACPLEPFCGPVPDGCGGYLDCSCKSAACVDGMCAGE